jgi:hypothetical protein
MARFPNGQIPPPGTAGSPLYTIAKGVDSNGYWEFQTTAGTHAKWNAAKRYAEKHFGRTIYIRSGWNIYRPLDVQRSARIRACNAGNCNAAAYPGYSSHGGSWGGRDCLAIDVDPNGLTWGQVWEACRAAGFSVGLITKAIAGIDEPWHIIDFDPWRAVPAGGGDWEPFDPETPTKEEPTPVPPKKKKRKQMANAVIYTDAAEDKNRKGAIVNTESGLFSAFGWFSVGYADNVAVGFGLEKAALVTQGHYDQIKRDCDAIRNK